ncbi:hypothetical protein [Devosia rhizoryzae]|uniref:Uncharacterized protein n=1 Tax=Devosia rhizoryzae TaxID=2774137 RepID=A0ABX7CDL7_9HYPH|nr:hypothetical protein [Devosia rhizoryzae]QQR40046.1 hypothetical protein JI748_03240 [Devosia rhizoryzae]
MTSMAGREAAMDELERRRAEAKVMAHEAHQADMFLEADIDAAGSAEEIESLLLRKKNRRPRTRKHVSVDNGEHQQLDFEYAIATDVTDDTHVAPKACRRDAIVLMRARTCGAMTTRSTWAWCSGGPALRKRQKHRQCAGRGGLIPLARSDLVRGKRGVSPDKALTFKELDLIP